MDWNFWSGADDLVVPKDPELLDRLPSPESWWKWGSSDNLNALLANKQFIRNAESICQDTNFIGKNCNHKVEVEAIVHGRNGSGASTACGRLGEGRLFPNAIPCNQFEQSRNQQSGLAGVKQMDDIFLDSILEDFEINEDQSSMFQFSPESEGSEIAGNILVSDRIKSPQDVSSKMQCKGSSKYLKTHGFSPSEGFEKGDWFEAYNTDPTARLPLKKELLVEDLHPSEEKSANGYEDEESSIEESVLLELKMAMAQLSKKTQMHFRDGLYRLAENTKHGMLQNQEEDLQMEEPPILNETSRWESKGATETKTNTIDRAIASLMFHNIHMNVRDQVVGSRISNSYGRQQASSQPHFLMLPCDDEVPNVSQGQSFSSNFSG